VVFLLTIPVPFFMGGFGEIPTVRLYFLLAMVSLIFATEGGSTVGTFVLLGAAQSLVYTGLFYLLARLVSRLVEGVVAERFRFAVLALVVLGLLGASLFEIYEMPLSSSGLRSSLVNIFD
jgi:hypothetical protein